MKEIIVKKSDDIICPNCKHTILNKGNLSVPDVYDRQAIETRLKNKEYKVKVINERNLKHLGKYWLLMSALVFHFGNTEDGWHTYYKAKFLPMIEFKLKDKIILYPASIAFDKMDQLEFDEYYKKIDSYLVEKGYNIDELIETSKEI